MNTSRLMQLAIDEWYRRETPASPRRRAAVIAEEYGLDPDALHDACQADFNKSEDAFADPAHA